MELGLRGRRALVTGASMGIGLAVSRELAAEGCNLVMVARSEETLSRVAAQISEKQAVEVFLEVGDVSQEDVQQRLISRHGDVDILVNNAGSIPAGDIAKVDHEMWQEGWNLKVFGYIALIRGIYERMCERRSGVIINVIGASGGAGDPKYIAGSTGNAALEALTRTLGSASPDHGVRIVGVSPGVVITERTTRVLKTYAEARFGDAAKWEDFLAFLPFGRGGLPEEIAPTIAFLASDRSSYTSGTIVTVDGGQSQRHKWWD